MIRAAFGILGPLDVRIDSVPVRLGPRQRLVLVALLLHPNQPIPGNRLVEWVWERPIRAGLSNLRTHIAYLRRVLGHGRIRSEPAVTGYRMVIGPGELDAVDFEAHAARGDSRARLGWALALWRGQVLEGLSLSHALQPAALRLEELRLAVLARYAQIRLSAGEPDGVAELIRPCLAEHPYREDLWAAMIQALYQSGQAVAAFDGYAQVRRTLSEGVGLDPGPQLRRLHQQMLAADPSLDRAGPPGQTLVLVRRLTSGVDMRRPLV